MKIEIISLHLENFKGAKNLLVPFNGHTIISGRNRSGKSTIADAFTWLLFGKDIFDRKDFSIKTLGVDGNAIPRIDHTVTGVLDIDGVEVTLKRTLREKWIKKRGEETEEFTGHETLYYKNDVPLSMKEYTEFIDSVISESTFKLLTVAGNFINLPWQERRSMLTSIADVPDVMAVASGDSQFAELLSMMESQQKSLSDIRKEVSEKKKKLRRDIDDIPPRMDEVVKATPEAENWQEISKNLQDCETQIADIRNKISDVSERELCYQNQRAATIKQKASLQEEINKIEYGVRTNFSNTLAAKDTRIERLNAQIKQRNSLIVNSETAIAVTKSRKEALEKQIHDLRTRWSEENSLTFNGMITDTCYACNQKLPANVLADEKAAQQAKFVENKKQKLDQINNDGKQLKKLIDDLDSTIINLTNEISVIKTEIASMYEELRDAQAPVEINPQKELDNNTHYQQLLKQLAAYVIPEPYISEEKEGYDKLLRQLEVTRMSLTLKLKVKETIDQHNARLKELKDQQKKLNKQLAELEKVEYTSGLLVKKHIQLVEEKVNSLFPERIRWRMFEQQINGGETPTCELLINGIPYRDANKAAQINAGISIINVFSKALKTTAPVWVDNAEAVNNLEMTDGQMVMLVVTADELTIKTL